MWIHSVTVKKVITRCNCAASMWDLSKFVATREFNFKIHHDSEWKLHMCVASRECIRAKGEKLSLHHLKWQHHNASARIPMHLQGGYLKIKHRILVDMHFRFPLFLIVRPRLLVFGLVWSVSFFSEMLLLQSLHTFQIHLSHLISAAASRAKRARGSERSWSVVKSHFNFGNTRFFSRSLLFSWRANERRWQR